MRILALDIGTRRTGVAFADDVDRVALALPTIAHASTRELQAAVRTIIDERGIGRMVIGLPLLPSGEEGEQTRIVRSCGEALSSLGLPITYLDERYTTPAHSTYDGDAKAAIDLLLMAMARDA